MPHTVLRLACLTALAVAVPVPPVAVIADAASASRMPEQRTYVQDVSSAGSDAQADVNANVDPSAVAAAIVAIPATAIVGLPAVGEEQAAALGAQLGDVHSQLKELDGGGFVQVGKERRAISLKGLVDMVMGRMAAEP